MRQGVKRAADRTGLDSGRFARFAAPVAVVAIAATAVLSFGPSRAGFTATTGASGMLAAAALFPTYPQAVVADDPLFYHRFEDAPGSVTAADSSGHGHPGVFQQNGGGGYRAIYPLDEGSGAVARDLSGAVAANDVTLTGTTWVPGQAGTGLSFDGTAARGAAAATGLDTSGLFTVSAWVYLSSTAASGVAVSQSGADVSGFELGYDQPLNKWVFRMPRSDSAGAVVDVVSGGTPALNTWTYLSGTLSTTTLVLYVNGSRVGTAPHTSLWNATGPLVFGAGQSGGVPAQYWSGRLDDVRTFAATFGNTGSASAAVEVVNGVTSGPSVSWQFNENSGVVTVDQSGLQNDGTLAGGTAWSTGTRRWGAAAAGFDGTDDVVAGAVPAAATDQAFSVSVWVYLTSAAQSRVAVSQDGATAGGFTLGFDAPSNRWSFEMPQGDSAPAGVDRVLSSAPPALNTWVNLIGVHDPGRAGAELTLYVGSSAVGTAAHTSTWRATGATVAGAAGGASRDRFWLGGIDDVRVYGRAVGAAEVGRLTANDPGSATLARTTLGAPGALQGPQGGERSSRAHANGTARNSYNPLRLPDPQQFTLECWFRTNVVNSGRALVSFADATMGNTTDGGDRRLFIDVNGNIAFGMTPAAVIRSSGKDYADGAWHHLAVSVDPVEGVALYVDGVARARTAFSPGRVAAGYWRWNGDTWGGGANWSGVNLSDYNRLSILDELAVYPRALSAQEIAVHHGANH